MKIAKELQYKALTTDQVKQIEEVKQGLSIALNTIKENCPESREKSLAITKLEEAVMWASKSISHTTGGK